MASTSISTTSAPTQLPSTSAFAASTAGPTTTLPPSPSPVSSVTAEFSLSLAGNFQTLLASSRSALEVSLRQDLGQLWNVPPDQVILVSLALGSLLVTFKVSLITEGEAEAGRLAAMSGSPAVTFSNTYALYTGPANGSPSTSSSFGLNSLSAPTYSATPTSNAQSSTTNVGLYVGISVGVAVLIGVVVALLVVRSIRQKAQLERFDNPLLQVQEMQAQGAERDGVL